MRLHALTVRVRLWQVQVNLWAFSVGLFSSEKTVVQGPLTQHVFVTKSHIENFLSQRFLFNPTGAGFIPLFFLKSSLRGYFYYSFYYSLTWTRALIESARQAELEWARRAGYELLPVIY
jgi:hypothetical protein